MKQSKLRRRRVIRYAVMYFGMFVVFVGLIVAPIVAGNKIPASITNQLSSTNLVQPVGLNNNDTEGHTQTGTGAADYTGFLATVTGASASASASASADSKIRLL